MSTRWSVTFDCADPAALAAFWCLALGYVQASPPEGFASWPDWFERYDADVTGVCPAIVATAEFDPLRDEGAAYAARLADAGVPTQYVPGPGLIHGFAGFLGLVDAADAAVTGILDRLTRALNT